MGKLARFRQAFAVSGLTVIFSSPMLGYDAVVGQPKWVRPLRERLKTAIDAGQFTQTAVAREAGVQPAAVSQFLSGTTQEPRAQVLIAGCKLLGISIDALVGLGPHASAAISPAPQPTEIANSRRFLERVAAAILMVTAAAEPGRQAAASSGSEPKSRPGTRTDR